LQSSSGSFRTPKQRTEDLQMPAVRAKTITLIAARAIKVVASTVPMLKDNELN